VTGRDARGEVDDAGPWLDPAETRTRLLLFGLPAAAKLAGVLASGLAAAVVLPAAAIDEGVRALCRDRRLPLIVRGDAAEVPPLAADGVHLTAAEQVAAARAALGRERIIGADCGLSRHAAMVAGEAGADYVQFGALDLAPPGAVADLVVWWSELFVLPCAAAGRFSPEMARRLAAAGADFLAVADANVELAQALVTNGRL
jgi:thiamine-phosphate pyrophosphorylase